MDDMRKQMVRHCAPTLAGMKTAGLFGYFFPDELALANQIEQINETLTPKGVRAEVLRTRGCHTLILVYREAMLARDLKGRAVRVFLQACGYGGGSVAAHLAHLKVRLGAGEDFPHEIGLFLGYPLHDVLGFILHGGRNSKCCGCWKVYGEAAAAQQLFAKYGKCTEVYERLFSQGRPIERLTVAA